jgi:hypothetical protein
VVMSLFGLGALDQNTACAHLVCARVMANRIESQSWPKKSLPVKSSDGLVLYP